MEVVTIGRSRDNNIRINDPHVGRHHCQIVQHDNGTYSIVDIDSINGTYVNGRRIFGEVRLQPFDSVTIGHTNLPWGTYFPPKSKSYALPIVLGSVGGFLLTIMLTLLIFRHVSDEAFAFKGDYPDAVVVNMIDEDGTPYTIEAIEEQVCVWFEESTPYKTAKKSIKASGGRIVAQIPEDGYYLVKVPADGMQFFLKRITKENGVERACPNIVFFPCMVNNYVLDTEYPDVRETDTPPHGIIVKYALWDSNPESPLKSYNIGGAKNGKTMNIDNWDEGGLCPVLGCSHNEYFALKDISRIADNEPIIINMSYGPALIRETNGKEVRILWVSATDDEKLNYKENYVYYIKSKIKNLSPLQDKDYIAVIAAGNDGIKDFGAEILSYLRNKLSPEEKEIMDKHLLLVTAGETEKANQYYSNEMEKGRHDSWVTKVDISDFKYDGVKWKGTSFAAPRAAGLLSSVANEMNLTGAEVLKLAKEATRSDGELTKDALWKKAVDYKQANSKHNQPHGNGMSSTGGSSTGGSSSAVGSPYTGSSSSSDSSSSSSRSSSNGGSSSAGSSSSNGGSSLPSGNPAEKAARLLGAAMCSGDVSTIRSLTTDDMYEEIMESFYAAMELVDENTRQMNKKKYMESPVETLSIGDNRIVVRFGSDGPQIDFYMMNENGRWIMYDCAQGGVHIPKDMRKRMR